MPFHQVFTHGLLAKVGLIAILITSTGLGLVACGESTVNANAGTVASTTAGGVTGSNNAPSLADTPSPTYTGIVPAPPASGTSRAGTIYTVDLVGEVTGDTVGITVFEPTTLTAGQTYPLVLHSHGYAGSRLTSPDEPSTDSTLGPSAILGSSGVAELIASGYGVISISERGSDESTGTIRVMDPDFEGHDLISVLDWAEHNLSWLRYGPSADGSDPHNLVVGSIGGSYGGMYQYLIHNIDPKRRLDAMVPLFAPSDLTYSLLPNGVIKAGWDSLLFLNGDTAGQNLDRGHTDPFIVNFFTKGLSTNTIPADGRDFFFYHSNQYFCGNETVPGNGEIGASIGMAGTPLKPGYAPVRGPKINVMLFQGMRDTLFTFNNAYQNYQCLKAEGGDVRLLSFQVGHNALQLVPDPGNRVYQPMLNELDSSCGSLSFIPATVAFFDEHLKGFSGAANKVIPTQTCLSLQKGDAVLVDTVTTGKAGTPIQIPSTTVVAGGNLDVPTAIPLGITASALGEVIGGMPYVEVDIEAINAALPGEAFLYLGIGQSHDGVAGNYDLIDNQITPIRGTGMHRVDMVGIAERLKPGDQLALLVYGQHDQYHVTGTVNAMNPAVVPVTIAGKIWVPMLGNLPNKPN